ncbi:MAG: stage V sporulation protein D [Clostridium sp.]
MGVRKLRDKTTIRTRGALTILVFVAVLLCLTIKLSYLMVVQSNNLKERAQEQWTGEIVIAPKRGKVLDRNGKELAFSANVYRLDVDLNALRRDINDKKNITMEEIIKDLTTLTGVSEEMLTKKMIEPLPNGKQKGSAELKRSMEKEQITEIEKYLKDKNIYGFLISPDTKRYYPNNNFLAHVIGATNSDGEGLMGIEQIYNEVLAGIPGLKISEMDKDRQDMPYVLTDYTKPVDGKNVVLSIDENIQFFAEKAADQALKDNKAKAVSVVVMDPNNGEILAMANKPDFNPNSYYSEELSLEDNQKLWRNRAVSDTFEPGSIFKVITATAALSEKKVSREDVFNCGGVSVVGGRSIHCWKTTGHGPQNFTEILKNSCNVGFMELGERLGPELLTKYIKLFGLGEKTGIDLNGESRGIIKAAEDISVTDLATISFGQTNTLSVIQYLRAFNAIANGGKLITPHLMREVTHYDDENNMVVDAKYNKYNEKQSLDEEVIRELRADLEKVISEGGGKKAAIQGYRIAGKTGTAQKIDTENGGYANGKYISSFAGMAPADNPQVTVMVSIDEPDQSNYYAGQIAAPVGQQLFNDIFNYYALKPNGSEEDAAQSLLKDVIVPEVRSLEIKDGLNQLKESGLKYKIEGDGKQITDINPKPGCSIKEGTEIIVYTVKSDTQDDTIVVPNLLGYNPERAEEILKSLGLKPTFVGKGMISSQSIKEGTRIKKGVDITLHLEILGD